MRRIFAYGKTRIILFLAVGLATNFAILAVRKLFFEKQNTGLCEAEDVEKWHPELDGVENDSEQSNKRHLVFVGVMTADKYLENRALSVFRTWGQNVPGRLVFFGGASAKSPEADFPLVSLPGVDDSYPPQKKSFLMLKYMYDNFLEDYEWFMRADDDVYVRGDRLETFLSSLNSSKPMFIGQAGMGNKEEFGMLNLAPGENFCMGGPGIIFSRETLRLIGPNIKYCLKHLYSTHEDVEVGRCIRKFAGIPCAWSYDMQTIFHHNQSGSTAFTGDLHVKEIHRAITLHPVKTSQHLHRIQNYYLTDSIQNLHHEILLLQRDIEEVQMQLEKINLRDAIGENKFIQFRSQFLNRFRPRNPREVFEWTFFTKSLYSHLDYNPKRGMPSSMKWSIHNLVMELMDLINQSSQKRGRIVDFRDLLYGFQRVDPLHGVQYILDLHLVYKRYVGKKMTSPVRRHSYLEQVFSWTEITEENNCIGKQLFPYERERDFGEQLRYFNEPDDQSTPKDSTDKNCRKSEKPKIVNFILPLSGRFSTFSRFLRLLDEEFFAKNDQIALTVVNFISSDQIQDSQSVQQLVTVLQKKYPNYRIELLELEKPFSRAVGLQEGLSKLSHNALLFFVDVDMAFNREFIQQVRENTKMGRMVYYPVVFSQYAPDKQNSSFSENFVLDEDKGYWRQFGFGIMSCYRSDFDAVGGFNLDIKGWGKEDVDLFEKFLVLSQNNPQFEIFRGAHPGIVHIYHDIECDNNLHSDQLIMCLGSRAASMSSQIVLAQLFLSRSPTNSSHLPGLS